MILPDRKATEKNYYSTSVVRKTSKKIFLIIVHSIIIQFNQHVSSAFTAHLKGKWDREGHWTEPSILLQVKVFLD